MIDTNAYEKMTWETPSDELEDAVGNLLAEVERLREENHEMGIALHDLGYRWDEETGEMYHRDDTRRGD